MQGVIWGTVAGAIKANTRSFDSSSDLESRGVSGRVTAGKAVLGTDLQLFRKDAGKRAEDADDRFTCEQEKHLDHLYLRFCQFSFLFAITGVDANIAITKHAANTRYILLR